MSGFMGAQPICPVCEQVDLVEKVSTLYLTGIEVREPQRLALSRKLAPPAAGKQATFQAIHPDLVVVVFSLIVPVFGYGILKDQPEMLLPVGIVLSLVYGAYFWQRKRFLERFSYEQMQKRKAKERIERGVGRWMGLYFCARDEGVFEPGSKLFTPIDQISGYLFKD